MRSIPEESASRSSSTKGPRSRIRRDLRRHERSPAAGPATAARSAAKCDPRMGRWQRRRRKVDEVERTAPHWEPPHGAAARRRHRTESLGGARAQRGEARTVMDLRRRGGAGAGSEQEKRGGGGWSGNGGDKGARVSGWLGLLYIQLSIRIVGSEMDDQDELGFSKKRPRNVFLTR